MHPIQKQPSRAACLACRARKIRCDGRHPCSRCSHKGLSCVYRPSRRGGFRHRAESSTHHIIAPHHSPHDPNVFPSVAQQSLPVPTQRPSISGEVVGDYDLSDIAHLLSPFSGIRNLDLGSIDGSGEVLVPDVEGNVYGTIGSAQSSHLRVYASEQEIFDSYYIHIHPFLPILQPPLSDQITDRPVVVEVPSINTGSIDRSSLPHWPASALTLAISAVLVLIPLPQDSDAFSDSSVQSRRSYAQMYAEAAFSEVDKEMDRICQVLLPRQAMASINLSQLSPVLALVLLSIYEYCQRGNVSRMRSRANQAVTAAMDLGLHCLGITAMEAPRRAWWSAMFVLYLSSVDQQVSPIITLDDSRITTPYPSSNTTLEPWPLLLQAEKTLITVWQTMDNNEAHPAMTAASSNMSEKIQQLDSHIFAMMRQLEVTPSIEQLRTGPDARAVRNMLLIARLLIHLARVRLHRYRAFMDIPLFLNKHCNIAAIQDKAEPAQLRSQPRSESFFPFTEEQSSSICLKSALAISRAFEHLGSRSSRYKLSASSHILPFFVCGAMQSSYVLLMTYYRLRAALISDQVSTYRHLLHQPESDTEIQDTERLLRELRQGVESILGSMESANMFEGVSGIGQEIQAAYHAAFSANT
ncbi:hypothetical protein ASPFODRAFT_205282 [Aspergillus luchuensis CBS 106.47]|uniref:Zn(2)-C6 fungal-type domain-containing protein n=1 Tax=Aspergillus luchuensis (strain CBS 106.47) TaxID=1137211 RepID=A0A1M3TN96_ASPLC|nr:hypothetical protein ASPFODRAFT_205282 [Aspergillus luchuensis CBS 106.47]